MSLKLAFLLFIAHMAVSVPVVEDYAVPGGEFPFRPSFQRCLIVYDPTTGQYQALVPMLNLNGLVNPNVPPPPPQQPNAVPPVQPNVPGQNLMLVLP